MPDGGATMFPAGQPPLLVRITGNKREADDGPPAIYELTGCMCN